MSFNDDDELEAFFDQVEEVIVKEKDNEFQDENDDTVKLPVAVCANQDTFQNPHEEDGQEEEEDLTYYGRTKDDEIDGSESTNYPNKRLKTTNSVQTSCTTMPDVVPRKAIVAKSAPTINIQPTEAHGSKFTQQESLMTSKVSSTTTSTIISHNTIPYFGQNILPSAAMMMPQPPPNLWGTTDQQQQHYPSSELNQPNHGKIYKRVAAGQVWEDPSLADFPENDFRCFVGNLGKDISDAKLAEAFSGKYPSFVMARVIFDKATKTSKGYGFVSFMDPTDCARAIREMDKSWIGSRPIQVKLSDWKSRDLKHVRKMDKKTKR